jgi:hypothetical protein
MFFIHCVCTTFFEVLHLFTICGLQRTKHTYNTRLKFVRRMRRKTTQDDVVLKAERQHVEGLVRFESVADQDPWFAVSALSRGRFKYFLHPFQIDVRVHVAFLAAGELPPWGVMADDTVAPVIDPREYDERRQVPTVSRDAFDCRDQRSLGAGASVGLLHLGTHEVLGGSKHTEQHSRLVHVVYVLLQYVRFL